MVAMNTLRTYGGETTRQVSRGSFPEIRWLNTSTEMVQTLCGVRTKIRLYRGSGCTSIRMDLHVTSKPPLMGVGLTICSAYRWPERITRRGEKAERYEAIANVQLYRGGAKVRRSNGRDPN